MSKTMVGPQSPLPGLDGGPGETPGETAEKVRPPRERGDARPAEAYALRAMADQFLTHLATSRRCSPRTIEAYGSDYRKIERLLAEAGHDLDVQRISTGDLQLCIASLSHLSAASVERLIYAVRSLFNYLVKRGIVDQNPAQDLALPQRECKLPRQVAHHEVERLLGACETTRERLIVALLCFCGLRRAELLSLHVRDVAADYSSVRVQGKARKERQIPLHPSLKPLLADHIAGLPPHSEALILNNVGKRTSPTTLWRTFRRIRARASLEGSGITPHALRHHFATRLIRAGVDVATVAELMGHSNISTTSVYLSSDSAAKRDAVSRLPAMPSWSASPSVSPRAPFPQSGEQSEASEP